MFKFSGHGSGGLDGMPEMLYWLHELRKLKTDRLRDDRYKDKEALQVHGSSDRFKAHGKRMVDEGLVEGPTKIMIVKPHGGFSRL